LGEIISINNQGYDNPNYEVLWFHNGSLVQTGGNTLLTQFTSGTISVEISYLDCEPVSTSVTLKECCPDDLYLSLDCENQSVTIENLPDNIDVISLSWSFNGDYISSQPPFATSINTNLGDGTYEVFIVFQLSNGTKCKYNISVEYVEVDCISSGEKNTDSRSIEKFNSRKEQITIYPNPTSDYINLLTGNDSGAYQLIDINGKRVLQQEIHHRNTSIDITSINPGIYFLQILDENGEVHVKKIIKN